MANSNGTNCSPDASQGEALRLNNPAESPPRTESDTDCVSEEENGLCLSSALPPSQHALQEAGAAQCPVYIFFLIWPTVFFPFFTSCQGMLSSFDLFKTVFFTSSHRGMG